MSSSEAGHEGTRRTGAGSPGQQDPCMAGPGHGEEPERFPLPSPSLWLSLSCRTLSLCDVLDMGLSCSDEGAASGLLAGVSHLK